MPGDHHYRVRVVVDNPRIRWRSSSPGAPTAGGALKRSPCVLRPDFHSTHRPRRVAADLARIHAIHQLGPRLRGRRTDENVSLSQHAAPHNRIMPGSLRGAAIHAVLPALVPSVLLFKLPCFVKSGPRLVHGLDIFYLLHALKSSECAEIVAKNAPDAREGA